MRAPAGAVRVAEGPPRAAASSPREVGGGGGGGGGAPRPGGAGGTVPGSARGSREPTRPVASRAAAQLKDVVKTLEQLNGSGRWKWLLHHRESKQLKEDVR